MGRELRWVAWLLVLSVGPTWAEEAKEVSVAEAKTVATLFAELADEDFNTRESAEQKLKDMDGKILPLVKERLKQSTDTEVQVRGDRVLKALALKGETNPEELARLAKEEALAKRYDQASKFYAKAAERFRQQSESASDEPAKKNLLAKAIKSSERQKRAAALVPNQATGEPQIAEGGGRMRIRMQIGAGAGGRVVVMDGNGEDNNSENADW